MAGVFVFSLQGFKYIPNIFFPPSDTAMFWAEIESPVGTAIERNEEIVTEIENFVEQELVAGAQRPEGITSWMAYIGNGGPRFTLTYAPEQSSPEYSFLLFNATSRGVIQALSDKIDAFCREQFPNVVTTIKPIPIGPIIDKPIEVRVSGEDLGVLFRIVEEVKAKIREIPGTRNLGDDWGQRTKKIVVKINNPRARRSAITNRDIAISLQSVLSGYQATDYREGDEVIPVTMRSVAADRKDFGKLESLNVYSQSTGHSVPLKQVADLEVEWQPAKIFRRDRLKSVKIHSDLALGVTPVEITNVLEAWLAEQQSGWPVGYFYSLGGAYEKSGEANRSIGEKVPIALILIVLLLVAQFNSIRKPLIILAAIPLGLIGVIAGLLIGQSYFGFMTLLGIISLSGIVINNAIVLLDRIQIEITENELDPARAVIEASQRRLRPILLTTIHNHGGTSSAVVGRRSDVGTDGDCHHLRVNVFYSAHTGCCTGPLQPVFSSQLQRLPLLRDRLIAIMQDHGDLRGAQVQCSNADRNACSVRRRSRTTVEHLEAAPLYPSDAPEKTKQTETFRLTKHITCIYTYIGQL